MRAFELDGRTDGRVGPVGAWKNHFLTFLYLILLLDDLFLLGDSLEYTPYILTPISYYDRLLLLLFPAPLVVFCLLLAWKQPTTD